METAVSKKFAILERFTKLKLYHSDELPFDTGSNDNDDDIDEIIIECGTLVKVYQTSHSTNKQNVTIQVLDFVNQLPIYENLYECPLTNLRYVNDSLWPYIINIENPARRLRVLQDEDHCKWLMYLKLNDFLSVCGEMFGRNNVRYDCIIRYIGPVSELYPVGYFFGLELLHLDSGYSPQSEKIPFSTSYMNCDPSLSIFTTADYIKRIPSEVRKKFSAREFLNGTIEKVKAAINPANILISGNSMTYSLIKGDKKPKEKEPTAQFYDNETEMERKLDSYLSHTDNDEFKQAVEHYEKNLEKRTTTSQTTQTTHTTQTAPHGILKHRRNENSNKGKDASNNKVLALNDDIPSHNIVVIDNADIKESLKQKEEIIVVDKMQNEMDLIELLGSNWPKTAGDAAVILNQIRSQNSKRQAYTSERNQAPNIINQSSGKSNNKLAAIEDNLKTACSLEDDFLQDSPLQELPNTSLGIGSMVEVNLPNINENLYGVIRWIGIPAGLKDIMIGLELEEDHPDKQLPLTDGYYNKTLLFKCPKGRGLFVTTDQCRCDRRFLGTDGALTKSAVDIIDGCYRNDNNLLFGQVECPIVPGAVAPIKCQNLNDLIKLCGKFKGIQGHHNSCYLDVTLFSMFAFTPVFDAVLFRPCESQDIPNYNEVQLVLREEIVNPLRKHMFVRADRVMKLRKLLDRLSSVSGLTTEEKDPEEFLNCLLSQILRAEPFLKLSSGQDAYYYQLFVEKDERLVFPSVQQLFEQSFYTSDIKLKEVPSCLIIQMPRFGKNYKMYPRILPSQMLDVTDIIEDSPRQCSVCGALAEYECRDCFGLLQTGFGLESTAFCPLCLETAHMHAKRANHSPRKLSVPQDFRIMAEHTSVPRLYMELFAIVCIETSHYVAFLKAGFGPEAPWCFFDSMADRKGEQNGYNIPEMTPVPDLPQWLSDEGARTVNETFSNDKMLPEHAKRLFCDAYMCMYQSTDVMMYR